jgi:hypothetical protein
VCLCCLCSLPERPRKVLQEFSTLRFRCGRKRTPHISTLAVSWGSYIIKETVIAVKAPRDGAGRRGVVLVCQHGPARPHIQHHALGMYAMTRLRAQWSRLLGLGRQLGGGDRTQGGYSQPRPLLFSGLPGTRDFDRVIRSGECPHRMVYFQSKVPALPPIIWSLHFDRFYAKI